MRSQAELVTEVSRISHRASDIQSAVFARGVRDSVWVKPPSARPLHLILTPDQIAAILHSFTPRDFHGRACQIADCALPDCVS